MHTQSQRFRYPKLRPGVQHTQDGNNHHLDYRLQGVVLEDPQLPGLVELLEDLKHGSLSTDELYSKYAQSLDAPTIESLIIDLDKHYLLTEGRYPKPQGVLSGREFSRRLAATIAAFHRRQGDSPLYQRMHEQRVTRSQLIGFAIEYYHIVKQAPRVISPALAHNSSPEVYQGVKKLFLEEHDHESLLADALHAVGIDRDKLKQTAPLSTTFSIYASLGVFARQHLLSFISSLFLFEEPYPEFNQQFIAACERLDLPKAFWGPIIGHSNVNEAEGHGNITHDLLGYFPALSEEETRVTLVHVCSLLELMGKWDSQICTYYQDAVKLRLFS
ncbi:iron-containing redox enzyme family protein [Pseudomonas xantholysinigenes]|uniref:Iron-containing redox enzyme family protein n=1 Tax=Pseudomonas xantholysinigenes TaxID=2745490 RepID=A0A9E6Q3D0_9PSED|nr:iron-containing redox enzyme family protein [Pseudomonas xantholysinigenes]QXI40481.1 iron-containing redox enzyme family protein [Pseudomonas xantholysinigenes]